MKNHFLILLTYTVTFYNGIDGGYTKTWTAKQKIPYRELYQVPQNIFILRNKL